jgi:hypothetical protein
MGLHDMTPMLSIFVRDEERSGAHPCRGGTGLAARMPTPDYDDIVGWRRRS